MLDLTEEVLEIPSGKHNRSKVEMRLSWTRTRMKQFGILENSAKGVWALTEQASRMKKVDGAALLRKAREMGRQEKQEEEEAERHGWKERLKKILLELSPDAFERLTQRLLRESGFVQVKVTGKTGDGGIDGVGIVKLHGIISFHMLFQCKRYKGAVSAGEIRDFRGAMQGRADKGLFITTGTFTNAAFQEANRAGTAPIDLLDGEALIEKLRELELGIKPVMDYTVDEEWYRSL